LDFSMIILFVLLNQSDTTQNQATLNAPLDRYM
jgi:hypothetical protein